MERCQLSHILFKFWWNHINKCIAADLKYRKLHERECISWFMGTSDVLKSSKLHELKQIWFENFKTSWSTINQEMHEQVCAIFCLLYFQQSYFGIKYLQHFIKLFKLIRFNFLVDFPICHPILPNFQPGLCCFQSILVLEFSFSCSTSLVWNSKK